MQVKPVDPMQGVLPAGHWSSPGGSQVVGSVNAVVVQTHLSSSPPGQQVKPPWQTNPSSPQTHVPTLQVSFTRQRTPQPPQLIGSAFVSRQTPPQHACPSAQVMPQASQLAGSS